VAVHDGARPLIAPEDIQRCLDAATIHGAAIMAVPVKDTLKTVAEDASIRHTVERQDLWQAQTPQVFHTDLLKEAFAKADQDGFVGTDEASLLEHGGWPVMVVEGSETNLKITRPDDLRMAEALLMKKPTHPEIRIGHGFDAHRLVAGRPLILGGLEITHELGLLGHSDADVLTHALCDAILGACGEGDIGRHFPDSDPLYKGISSIRLLAQVIALAAANISTCTMPTSPWWPNDPNLPPIFRPCKRSLPKSARLTLRQSTSRPAPRKRWVTPDARKESVPTP
jgi:2-C-methyl-D-erythritol 2,4-cyclodiphosphate synthase